ncbi:acyl-CoA dehydrogenase family protein [Nocardia higoensis]|uniref:acyl-CoA dehydrogenase family protein n=1 Tax=Nocardia higoensis TaxID=228599 RepID=UPI0002D70872|nr:acyl-CoA dehydrogenase family protein [Nocardia higoensis]
MTTTAATQTPEPTPTTDATVPTPTAHDTPATTETTRTDGATTTDTTTTDMATMADIVTAATPTTNSTATWIDRARIVGEFLRPEAAERDRTGELSRTAFDLLREHGLSAAGVPAEFGGGGATHTEVGAILRELGRHDPSTAVAFAMHCHLVATQVWRHKHGADASGVLGKVAAGAILVSTGASDWVASTGHAERVDGGYRVSARKAPASGCEAGTILVTSIRWDDAPEGPRVLHCAVPFSAPGVRIEQTWDTLGLRATGSHTVVLDDVFVPDAAVSLIRPADAWPPLLNTVIGAAMPLIVAAYLGIADGAVDTALSLSAGRSDAHVVQTAGEMANAHTTAADLATAMFADSDDLRFDNTDAHAARTLGRKTVAADQLIATVRLAMETVGGLGYSRGCDIERRYRDVHGILFHPLPRAKQLRFTGNVRLGHSPLG